MGPDTIDNINNMNIYNSLNSNNNNNIGSKTQLNKTDTSMNMVIIFKWLDNSYFIRRGNIKFKHHRKEIQLSSKAEKIVQREKEYLLNNSSNTNNTKAVKHRDHHSSNCNHICSNKYSNNNISNNNSIVLEGIYLHCKSDNLFLNKKSSFCIKNQLLKIIIAKTTITATTNLPQIQIIYLFHLIHQILVLQTINNWLKITIIDHLPNKGHKLKQLNQFIKVQIKQSLLKILAAKHQHHHHLLQIVRMEQKQKLIFNNYF